MVVGILALQGSIEPHAKHLKSLGVDVRFVRLPQDFQGISGLILPGGESTTMINLAKVSGVWELLKNSASQIPYWGICAGSILMAKTVENPSQESLAAMDISVRRNAYGRQLESFTTTLNVKNIDATEQAEAVFIRAPKFISWGPSVTVLAKINEDAVFLEQGKHMVTAFHPELTEKSWCHKYFLNKIDKFFKT